jgi:hypothetical protein
MVRPDNHKTKGQGCKDGCRERILRAREFIRQATEKHAGLYTYEHVEADYRTQDVNIRIHCTDCGITFKQMPINHLAGSGCQECAK